MGSRKVQALVRYVPRHIQHHGQHSGYDRLFSFMGLKAARSGFWSGLAGRLPKFLLWRLWSMRPQATQQLGLEAELGAMPWVARGSGRLCHFIYGEDTFFFSPLWKKGTNKVLATFHYPPQRLVERVNPGSLRALDGVVIVGENQRDYFRRFFADDQIHYCRHQVDTAFFQPSRAAGETAKFRLVCVGQVFRDYSKLLETHRQLRLAGIDCETHVVGPKSLLEQPIAAAPGVFVQTGLSDDALLKLYQDSSVGVLPLTDSTANNALLEMMACGLPVVVSAVGGVPDYVSGSAVQLVADDGVAAFVDRLTTLRNDPDRARQEGERNRQFAVERLSDEVAAANMWQIYETVLGQ